MREKDEKREASKMKGMSEPVGKRLWEPAFLADRRRGGSKGRKATKRVSCVGSSRSRELRRLRRERVELCSQRGIVGGELRDLPDERVYQLLARSTNERARPLFERLDLSEFPSDARKGLLLLGALVLEVRELLDEVRGLPARRHAQFLCEVVERAEAIVEVGRAELVERDDGSFVTARWALQGT